MDGWMKGRKKRQEGEKEGGNWEQKDSTIFTNIHWQIISSIN